MRYRWCTLGRALATAGAILLSAMVVPASAENESQPCNADGQGVAYGDVLAGCTINPVADLDTFTFNAAPDDVLRLILTRTGGVGVPCTEIRGPDNTIFRPMTCGNFDMVLPQISMAGIYQVVVTDQLNDQTLVFNLSLERVFPLRAPVPVPLGDVLTGLEINPVADLDTFTFTAAPDDVLRLILTRTGGVGVPCTEIRGPDNTIFRPMTCGNFDMVLPQISVAGIYQVIVTDQLNDQTLVFNLSLERLFPLRAPVPVPPGDVLTGLEINPVADLDTFTFNAAPDDVLRLILTRTGGVGVPCTEIRGPDNTIFRPMTCGNFDMVLPQISVAGIYQVVVTDQLNDQTLVFNLSLERLFPLRAPVPVPPGHVLTGLEINPVADLDTFIFVAAPDDVLRLILTRTGGVGVPCTEIRGPDNSIFLQLPCGNVDTVLPAVSVAGIYQVVVTDQLNDQTLVFNMSLSCLSGTCANRQVDRDFNGDGSSDILWRHTSGLVYVWLLDGTNIVGQGPVGGVTSDWTIAGVGDFNGDKKSDILWRHTSGTVYVWLLDGTNIIGQFGFGEVTSDWTIAGVGDFNGDQRSDILWRHTSGLVYVWLLDGTNIIGQGPVGGPTSDWAIAGVGDFNGDKKSDILWRHTSGLVYEWLLDGTNIIGQGGFGEVTSDWTIAGVGDFNGDQRSDILWRNTSSGLVYEWLLDGTNIIGQGVTGGATSDWTIVRAGDFNGDRISDIMWRRTSGTVYEWLLAGLIIVGQGSPGGPSADWQIQ